VELGVFVWLGDGEGDEVLEGVGVVVAVGVGVPLRDDGVAVGMVELPECR
jgi:hypothetical protein